MPYVQVKKKYQVTIPVALRRQIKINEGDMMEAKVSDGMIVFIPQILISKQDAFDKSDDEKNIVNVPNKETKKGSWKNLPACGMWEDREDMKNPTEYVKKLREPRYPC